MGIQHYGSRALAPTGECRHHRTRERCRLSLAEQERAEQRRVYVCVTGDYDAAPDIDVLCEAVETGLTELVAAAKAAQRKATKRGHPAEGQPVRRARRQGRT